MAHRHRPGADEALPAFAQRQPFDRPADRIGPVQHPHRFPMLCRRFEHVTQRRDEGIDAATEILQIDKHDIESIHHRVRRPAHFAVQAEHRDAVHRIVKSGDSIMLSCLSPRSPCCGPKAAASLMSPQAASASSECIRSAVTEAGCASSATRRPASGARSAGSPISRSMPNFIIAKPECSDTNSADQASLRSLPRLRGREGRGVARRRAAVDARAMPSRPPPRPLPTRGRGMRVPRACASGQRA